MKKCRLEWLNSGISLGIIGMFTIIKQKDTLTFGSRCSSQLSGSDQSIWVRRGQMWLLARAELSLDSSLCDQNLHCPSKCTPMPCPDPWEQYRVPGNLVCKSSPRNSELSTCRREQVISFLDILELELLQREIMIRE